MRIKSWFGVIKATNQRPTGAVKLQTNFQTGLNSLQLVVFRNPGAAVLFIGMRLVEERSFAFDGVIAYVGG